MQTRGGPGLQFAQLVALCLVCDCSVLASALALRAYGAIPELRLFCVVVCRTRAACCAVLIYLPMCLRCVYNASSNRTACAWSRAYDDDNYDC